jgi:hypothetical protein
MAIGGDSSGSNAISPQSARWLGRVHAWSKRGNCWLLAVPAGGRHFVRARAYRWLRENQWVTFRLQPTEKGQARAVDVQRWRPGPGQGQVPQAVIKDGQTGGR